MTKRSDLGDSHDDSDVIEDMAEDTETLDLSEIPLDSTENGRNPVEERDIDESPEASSLESHPVGPRGPSTSGFREPSPRPLVRKRNAQNDNDNSGILSISNVGARTV